jgi:hypothetical protein
MVPAMPAWRRASLAVLLLGAAACSSSGISPAVLQTWVGKPVTGLRQEWGAATRELPDSGLTLYIYEELERRTGQSFEQPNPEQRPNKDEMVLRLGAVPPRVYVRSYLFWADRDGKIVRAEVRQP